ncbi:MAG: hypothetical protein H2069_00410 [Legionella sp.]|nr:hypothetical protein [Legionella sp.]
MNNEIKLIKILGSGVFLFGEVLRNLRLNAKFKKETADDSIENNQIALKDKHRKMIIQQALSDLEFNGPVHVVFANQFASTMFFSSKGCSAVVYTPPTDDDPRSDESLYSSAGHEGGHVIHYHAFLKRITVLAMIYGIRSPSSAILLPLLLLGSVSRLFERDADLTPARKINTAKYYVEYFSEKFLPFEQSYTPRQRAMMRLLGPHPMVQARIDYLKPLITNDPLPLFKSERYHQILKERAEEQNRLDFEMLGYIPKRFPTRTDEEDITNSNTL